MSARIERRFGVLLMLCALLGGGPRPVWAQAAAPADAAQGWLGIGVRDLSIADAFQAGLAGFGGASVVDVLAGSPAEAAGLQIGDVIAEIDGKPVTGADVVVKAVGAKRPGEAVPISILRNGQSLQLRAVAGRRPTGGAAQPGSDVVQVPLDDACARFFCPACKDLDVRVDVPPSTECLQCYSGFAALIAECRRRGGAAAGGVESSSAGPAAVAVPLAAPALELNAVRAVPSRVAPSGKFAVEVTFTARNPSAASGSVPVSFSYAIEQGEKTLLERAAETIEAPNGQSWRIVKSLAATRATGQYTIRVKLVSGQDTVQGSTVLIVE